MIYSAERNGESMKRKTEEITAFLVETISRWTGVECICLDQRAELDELDPHYALVLDVYFRRKIPAAERRQSLFNNPGAFESAAGTMKDRFFLDEIPIRVEYKAIPNLQDLVERPMKHFDCLKILAPIHFIDFNISPRFIQNLIG